MTETDFNGRTLTYTHDAAGRVTARTNGAGETLRFARDPLGRLVEQRSDADDVTTFAYAADGRLAQAVNADADVAFTRDAMGRIVSETINGRTTTYAYDALGRRVRRETPSGPASHWTYDPAGMPTQLRSEVGVLTFTHDAAGRETRRHLGSGVVLTQTWDEVDRLTAQSLTAGAHNLLQHRAYAYRADGHLTEIRELATGTRRFDLDTMGRVTGVRAHGWSETYAYDSAGNLTDASAAGHAAAGGRDIDGMLIRRAGDTTYTYDSQGRRTHKTRKLLSGQAKTWAYAWNAEDRLVEVVTPEGDRWRYVYDPLGRRIAKFRHLPDGSEVDRTDFTWEETLLAEQILADGRVTTWDYAPGTHRPVAQTSSRHVVVPTGASFLTRLAEETTADHTTRFHAVITDVIGTPAELVSSDGDVGWQRRTALWGTRYPTPADDAEAVDCPLRFPGQYADAESGLNQNLHRYYDPETAAYLSPDPLGLEAGSNPYWYGPHPLTWTDPYGLALCRTTPRLENGAGIGSRAPDPDLREEDDRERHVGPVSAHRRLRGRKPRHHLLPGRKELHTVITVQFTVRPGQGDASGFDLGDMAFTGDLGTADSAGHVPDQGMMIYLSVVQLLDSLGAFLQGNARVLSFTGADTSFGLVVRRTKDGLPVAGKSGVVARTTAPELASAVLRAAEDLGPALPPEDPVASDWEAALAAFRPLVRRSKG